MDFDRIEAVVGPLAVVVGIDHKGFDRIEAVVGPLAVVVGIGHKDFVRIEAAVERIEVAEVGPLGVVVDIDHKGFDRMVVGLALDPLEIVVGIGRKVVVVVEVAPLVAAVE